MISKRLISIRKSRKITQKTLSEALGLDDINAARVKISHYENDRYIPSFDTVCKIADYLGVPEGYFYTRDENLARRILELYENKEVSFQVSDDILCLQKELKNAEDKIKRYKMAIEAFKKVMPK
ncbi:helix-turn-helix transcriptional regulator (plasmid) [Xenorhabdus sp. SF857]|uniref:helix-turn-helix domain-containing protein n=1 Tax=Xenorhabdus bakwenae TaxID=3026967 RepID=UPI002557FDA5|nr:helix-turn-helix transcriptional regulator [Xenorhabdus sp. SF857]WFQ78156.1 helix-turn-helix transcriptional regulator [Xenorhabdus sp. SF857]